jgi:hypothetical protein
VRSLNLALKFALELAALAALAVAGASVDAAFGVRLLLAVLAPLAAAAVWGAWCAPRARRRLPTGPRIAVELLVLLSGAAALALAGHTVPAAILAGLVVVNETLLVVLGDADA